MSDGIKSREPARPIATELRLRKSLRFIWLVGVKYGPTCDVSTFKYLLSVPAIRFVFDNFTSRVTEP